MVEKRNDDDFSRVLKVNDDDVDDDDDDDSDDDKLSMKVRGLMLLSRKCTIRGNT